MATYSRLMLLALPAWAALACATPAHAGMLGWMDSAFTFRKEQKPLVAPQRGGNTPPKAVVQPYYPNDEHVSWSNFYTRTDLETQDYLSSSASKVMRPNPQAEAARTRAQAQGGWNAIAEQAAENAMAEAAAERGGAANVMIGEPGEGWGMQAGDSNVGRATRIGPAVEDWRGNGGSGMASRPGDYDYRAPAGAYAQAETPTMAIGDANPTARTSGGGSVTFATASDDPRYVEHNTQGQVTKYKVQGGDTLSSISDQPAIYGNWKKWPLIYSANRGAIGSKPSNLKRDQRLDIPRDYTSQQEADAIKRSGGR